LLCAATLKSFPNVGYGWRLEQDEGHVSDSDTSQILCGHGH